MEFSLKPDFDQCKKRYDAFWNQKIIDRPPISITIPVENPVKLPWKQYQNNRDRWLDVDFRAEEMSLNLKNQQYMADALPVAFPNMGPEIFSAWCGCEYEFGDCTTWSQPCIDDWEEESEKAVLNMEHPLFKATEKYTRRLLEYGKGNFIVGLTDFHPGGDHLAALRDPANLAIDLLENDGFVKAKLKSSQKEFFKAYDYFYNILKNENMPITSWLPLIHDNRYYIPSNDFSCMISSKMFEEFFLEGIINECRFYERSIYHLDGPGALRHLDMILDIKELDAVQWAEGAGNEGYEKWIHIYQIIQKAGKSLQLPCLKLDEIPMVFETLKPEGVWFSGFHGIHDADTANRVINRISAWK